MTEITIIVLNLPDKEKIIFTSIGIWKIFHFRYQGSTLTFETSGPSGPPEVNCTLNLGGPV